VLLGARTFRLDPTLQKALGLGAPDVWRGRVTLWWLVAVPAVVALLMRRRWPLAAFAVAAASAGWHRLDPNLGLLPIDLIAVITLGALANLARSRRTALLALTGGLVVTYVACLGTELGLGPEAIPLGPPTAPFGDDPPLNALAAAAVPALLLGSAWAIGDNLRTRRLHLATLQQRAADLRRDRDQRALLAVAAERARITRELHDVVAHGMSVIVVQAQAAEAALPPDSTTSREALRHVIGTGRASLAEMRRLLGIVRPDAPPALDPQPGMAALPALVDEVREVGTPVTLQIEGEPAPLPAAVDLAAYRIIQEALTNTRKHAGPGARAVIRLAFTGAYLQVDIADDGPAPTPAPAPDGHGLRGIRERVAALGGELRAGPQEAGGFAVRVRLPTADSP
jgi:signal transduction histidine kinase